MCFMELYSLLFKENMMYLDSNRWYKYKIKFKFNSKIYITIITCKIVRNS